MGEEKPAGLTKIQEAELVTSGDGLDTERRVKDDSQVSGPSNRVDARALCSEGHV